MIPAIALAVLTALTGVCATPVAGTWFRGVNHVDTTDLTDPPSTDKIETIKRLLGRDDFEWTSLGDSYGSGDGAGNYTSNSYRCLRYTKSYPALMDAESRLNAGTHTFRNGACSGSKTHDVNDYQLYDGDSWWYPDYTYGFRPRFGNPRMATLSIGGNDVDFTGLIFNCILELSIPMHSHFGIPNFHSCEEQKAITWMYLRDPKLVDNIADTIDKVVTKGRIGPVGKDFKLYVTGYPQLFNNATEGCDHITFARKANPVTDGQPHLMMTQAARTEFNSMSTTLNAAIQAAVARQAHRHVRYINVDDAIHGHRFCEEGVREPDQTNPNTWLFHYPYHSLDTAAADDAVDGVLQAAYDKVKASVDLKTAFKDTSDFQSAVYSAINISDPSNRGDQDSLWTKLGNRIKVFHPQVPLHEATRDMVLDAYAADIVRDGPHEPNAAHDTNDCNSKLGWGDYFVKDRDVAVENVKAFCQQDLKEVMYNSGTVNELSLSVHYAYDDTLGPQDSPDCEGRFTRAVIDGCDGGDMVNNPRNKKYGSTLSVTDGWQYTMKPLKEQINEISCDVSYIGPGTDKFEIRGKNLPDSKLGVDGYGLWNQVKGCGAMTRYHFHWTPDDVKFEWYATGHTGLGSKTCIGNALVAAGGPDRGNCGGPG